MKNMKIGSVHSLVKYFSLIVCFSLTMEVRAVTIGELVDSTQSYLECKELNWFEQAVCEDAAIQMNSALNRYGVSFYNGDVVKHDDSMFLPRQLDTGHSCSHTAYLTGGFTRVTLRRNGVFDFSGNSISQPLIWYMRLPVDVYARANLREEWGTKYFGKCVTKNADNYWASLEVSTTLTSRILFSFEPKMLDRRTAEGDYIIEIDPQLQISSGLDRFDANFDFHGMNPVNGVFDFFWGITDLTISGLINFHTFDKDELERDIENYRYDIYFMAYAFLSTEVFGSASLTERLVNKAIYEASRQYDSEMNRAMSDIEKTAYSRISSALQLDSEGKKTIVVKRSVVDERIASMMVPVLSLLN